MSMITQIGCWTVDFRSKHAYVKLPNGFFCLRINQDGAKGLVTIRSMDEEIVKRIQYPATWEEIEDLPLVEIFGKHKMVIR